jgi:SAM-dependent methyltransferase
LRPRIAIARALLRLGGVAQSLALPVMRPRNLVELNRLHYSRPEVIALLSEESYVDGGLTSGEASLLERLPLRKGRLLDLDAGASREAIALARIGFEVTCIDFLPELVEKAKANAARRRLRIQALTQEAAALDLPEGGYDIAWLTPQMYSSIPGQAGRIHLLQGIARTLKPGGLFACQFRWHPQFSKTSLADFARRAVAVLSAGYLQYEKGDRLLGNSEFAHCFCSEAELRTEFVHGGFDTLDLRFDEDMWCGWAVLKKRQQQRPCSGVQPKS